MLNENNLHGYQKYAVEHIISHQASGLLLDCGLGKTVSTLTAVNRLMYDSLEVTKVLIIAPKRVALDTWPTEIAKWEHLKHLRASVVMGPAIQRKRALQADADLYIINRENVAWLVGYLAGSWPFDMVIADELSSFKSAKSQRFKALRLVRPKTNRFVGLTGTPAPNGLMDLWSEVYLLDQGERLGKTITGYRERYFTPGRSNGHVVFDYRPRETSEAAIYNKISDICISMKSEDYLQLPPRMDQTHNISLTSEQMQQYKDFEKQQVLVLADAENISAINAAALSGKLLQYANGAIYDADKNWHEIHEAKLDTLEEIVESANGNPVLVFYNFKHDLERILARLRHFNPKTLNSSDDIRKWNSGQISVLLAHPASAGHGLNLQAGGNTIVWFGLNWSLELYQQANARLYRQGQTKPVIIHHLVTAGTIDEDIMRALNSKANKQDALMDAVKARINQYIKTA